MLVSIVKSSLQCRMCRRIGIYVLLSILAVEAAILLPSYLRYEQDLVGRQERVARAAVVAAYLDKYNAPAEKILATGEALVRRGMLAGGVLYEADGRLVGRFGNPPDLATDPVLRAAADHGAANPIHRSPDGPWYDVVWSAGTLGLPYTLVGRIDAAPITTELAAFVWRILGLVLLISTVVCAATMTVVGRSVLSPLLRLRDNLTAASKDPDHVDRYTMPMSGATADELGDVIAATNLLLEQVAASHRDSLHAMTAMAEQAADAILAYDAEGHILYANRACVKMCGFREVAEMRDAGLPRFVFADANGEVALPESLAAGAYSREAELVGHGGRRTAVVVNASRVPTDSRSPMRYFASITDISELRRAQEKLEQQNIELRAASRAKSEFLANMSHELRTPLNAVIGFSEAFMNGLFGPLGDARYKEYARDINDSGHHLLRIINDILDLSKIEAGKMRLSEGPLQVPQVVEAAVRFIRERAESGGLRLTVTVNDKLPRLRADERAVKQMLINLLSNAVKFTPPGGEVTVAAWREDETMALAVSDTGMGMKPEDIPLALEPFRQVDGSLARQHEGTGLGLPLVKSLIELHGGTCHVDSVPGVGTRITLRFPPERTMDRPGDPAARSVA